jgi:CRP-like cAMP-binding protein
MTEKLLTRYPLFRLLSPRQLDDWLAAGQEIDCPAGFTLLQENTPGAWVHLLREGRVRVLRHSGRREVSLGVLLPGDVFGEYALLPPGNNTATCRTAAPARLVRLPLAPLRAALEGLPPVWKNLKNWLRLHTLLHFRRERTFLGFMSAESGLKLHDRMRPATFPAGQTIQANGLAAECWYLIEHGTVRLRAASEPESAGVELGPGEAFGERALLGSGDLPVAVALSDVRCQVLVRHAFDSSALARSNVAQSYEPRLPGRPEAHAWVPQVEKSDCGLAALAMVALRRGARVSVAELRRRVTPGPDGLTLQQLRQVAAEVGLPCQSARVAVERLDQVSLPVIAHLSGGHYVVLHELAPGGVVVGDPATGIVTWNAEHLRRSYSGALLLFDPPADPGPPDRGAAPAAGRPRPGGGSGAYSHQPPEGHRHSPGEGGSTPAQIQSSFERLRGGDEAAREGLLCYACERLRTLADKALRKCPGTPLPGQPEVLENAALRLRRALQDLTPGTARDFYRLAALHIRRELLDLAVWQAGPAGLPPESVRVPAWADLHRRIDALPDAEREVFDLLWYHELSPVEAARLLDLPERAVKGLWLEARRTLSAALQGEAPE